MASWSIACMLKEPVWRVQQFVAFHLDAGASYLHLFFDDPNDPAADMLESNPNVRVERCSDDFWREYHRRPPFQERRQIKTGLHAYQRCDSEWQCYLDADEFIVSEGASVAGTLDGANDKACFAMSPMEPLCLPDGSEPLPKMPFKTIPITGLNRILGRAYGSLSELLNAGLLGHSRGKSFLKSGFENASHGVHFPRFPGTPPPLEYSDSLSLAHMHCENREAWIDGAIRKANDPYYNLRARDGDRIFRLTGFEGRKAYEFLFDRANRYDGKLKRILDRNGLVRMVALDREKISRRMFGDAFEPSPYDQAPDD